MRMEQAMLEQMTNFPFEKITVKIICNRAGVNRSTFYAHYTDIYDMIEQMENNLRKELMEEYPVPGSVKPLSVESFLPFLMFIREHREFYRVALKTRVEFPIKQGFEELWNQIIKPLSLKAGIVSEKEMMLYWIGFQAGFTMILRYWVENDCTESVELLAEIIHNVIPTIWTA
ncbi:MAG: TetR/AcrR family transcriptional regulator [Lachnospiraceae bacterium]